MRHKYAVNRCVRHDDHLVFWFHLAIRYIVAVIISSSSILEGYQRSIENIHNTKIIIELIPNVGNYDTLVN